MLKKIFLIFTISLLPMTIFATTYYTIYPTKAGNTYAKPINALDAVTYSEGMSNPPLPTDNIVTISADKNVYIQPVLTVSNSSDIGKEATALMYVVINGEGAMLDSYTTTLEDKTVFKNISSSFITSLSLIENFFCNFFNTRGVNFLRTKKPAIVKAIKAIYKITFSYII